MQAQATQPAQRREPAFDLEDELLKELEIYQQPAVEARNLPRAGLQYLAVRAAISWNRCRPRRCRALPVRIEPGQAELEPVRHPVILEAVETFARPSGEHVYERPASHPVFDLEDEILREFAALTRRVTRIDDHPVAAEDYPSGPAGDRNGAGRTS